MARTYVLQSVLHCNCVQPRRRSAAGIQEEEFRRKRCMSSVGWCVLAVIQLRSSA